MCKLQQMTRAQLETMTKDAIVQLALEGMTIETITARDFNADGEMTRIESTITDAYSGVVVETKKINKTFHQNKAIDKISIDRRDGGGKKIEKYHIKHSADGNLKPYRVNDSGEDQVMTISGAPMSFTVISDTVDKSQSPVISIFGKKVPVMSNKLWNLFRG